MRGIQFAELNAFAAVAEHRNFTKAAAQLSIARPTLSQTIRSLEERLGVRLFNRTTRSVAVTEAGERLLSYLQPALLSLDNAIEAVNSFRDTPAGRLRLAVIRHAATALIAPMLPRFLEQYPEIELEIAADDGHGDIVEGRFDAGIRVGELIDQDMITLRILDEYEMVAAAAPSYLRDRPAPSAPRDLQDHNCIRQRLRWGGSVKPWEFERDGERVEISVEGSLIVNDTELVLSAVLDGVGIAYLPEGCLRAHFAAGRLVPVLRDWSARRSGLFLYYPSHRQIPVSLRIFVDFMRKQRRSSAW